MRSSLRADKPCSRCVMRRHWLRHRLDASWHQQDLWLMLLKTHAEVWGGNIARNNAIKNDITKKSWRSQSCTCALGQRYLPWDNWSSPAQCSQPCCQVGVRAALHGMTERLQGAQRWLRCNREDNTCQTAAWKSCAFPQENQLDLSALSPCRGCIGVLF